MKLIHRDASKDGPGSIKMVAENQEDLWHAYNLITVGDSVTSTTVRKVQKESASGASSGSERMKFSLCISVENVDYDSVGGVLRLSGKNTTENEYVKLGAYHTLELDVQRPFTIQKSSWDALSLEIVKNACDPAASADLAAVVMNEGLAHVCLVGGAMTVVRARIEQSLPRKKGAAVLGYDKALNKFFENTLQAVIRHVDFNVVNCLVIASPGFTKNQFFDYMMAEAQKRELKPLLEARPKIVLAHSSTGYKHSLQEVLTDPAVAGRIKDTKAAREVAALDDFYAMMSSDSARAFYGPGHVAAAHEQLAIQTLLLSDALFRNADVATRRKYVDLVESVKASGGDVHIFSSAHPSGEQLQQLTGIAAILRFPLPELEDAEL
eukprot:jgi/Mesvir1/4265/Mv22226-RA.1